MPHVNTLIAEDADRFDWRSSTRSAGGRISERQAYALITTGLTALSAKLRKASGRDSGFYRARIRISDRLRDRSSRSGESARRGTERHLE